QPLSVHPNRESRSDSPPRTMAKFAVQSVVLFLLGPMRFCCIQYQETKVLVKVLKSYRIQDNTGYCNIKAVVMKRNKDFCGNPDDEWVVSMEIPVIQHALNKHPAQLPPADVTQDFHSSVFNYFLGLIIGPENSRAGVFHREKIDGEVR
uniref:Chemokine interleukin-8-like domain-containing protein n=1 Tax=Stegastes partitus TaxID=144197 RepID=A0A3B5BNK1_9TELE